MADLQKVLNKRREFIIESKDVSEKGTARQILKRFLDQEVSFLILIANGRANVQRLQAVNRIISQYITIDKLKSGKDRHGNSFMRVRIKRAVGFLTKFDQ